MIFYSSYVLLSSHGFFWIDVLKQQRRHLSEVTDPAVDVPGYSGVVPRADARLSVEEVYLALLCGPLFCRKTGEGHLKSHCYI